jgi:hypothetical protein
MKTTSTLNAWILIVACILACFCLALSVHATTQTKAEIRRDQLGASADVCGRGRNAILKEDEKSRRTQ